MIHSGFKPQRSKSKQSPTELRIKPNTGILELDIPLDPESPNYDRVKGMRWGAAMADSPTIKAGGRHGLAGGFGIGAAPPKMPTRSKAGPTTEPDGYDDADFNEAARQDRVLRQLTLGGLCQQPPTGVVDRYVGVFDGGKPPLPSCSS
jgi:DNA-directed RNA polymerase III subunit RPC5